MWFFPAAGAFCFSRSFSPRLTFQIAVAYVATSDFPAPASAPPAPARTLYRSHGARKRPEGGIHRLFAGTVLHSRCPPCPTGSSSPVRNQETVTNSGEVAVEFFARPSEPSPPPHSSAQSPLPHGGNRSDPSDRATTAVRRLRGPTRRFCPSRTSSWSSKGTTLKGRSSSVRHGLCVANANKSKNIWDGVRLRVQAACAPHACGAICDPEALRIMLGTAVSYDRIAERAEERGDPKAERRGAAWGPNA